ncbi:MAG: 4-(cytidine 5'-diphospho)-2-C-methyl-D-erythritol kinase, partial [Dehalococcoidia bacterium]
MRELRGLAPAKVNLVLEVLGKRADGYHDVATVLQTLEVADELTLSPGEGALTVTGPYAAGAPADSSNLVARAIAALREGGVRLPGLDIHIEKHIPAAAGLGG